MNVCICMSWFECCLVDTRPICYARHNLLSSYTRCLVSSACTTTVEKEEEEENRTRIWYLADEHLCWECHQAHIKYKH